MKLWEVIKALTEDPTKKFEAKLASKDWTACMRVDTGFSRYFKFEVFNGKRLIDQSRAGGAFNGNVELDLDWQLVRQPVTWQEAIQAWVSVEDRLPESGKHVLLCCDVRPSGKRYVCDGYYAGSKSITSGYSDDWDCEYDEETDEHYLPEGYYEVIKNWDDCSSIVIDDFVTHWQPLPEPPKGE